MIDVILYGAGSDIEKIIPMMKKRGYKPQAIADGNIDKVGGFIENIPIISPDKIVEYDTKVIIITASFFDSIYERIKKELGNRIEEYKILVAPYAWLMLVNVNYNSDLLKKASKYISDYKEDIYSIYNTEDNRTKEILDFIIKARTRNEYTFFEYNEIKGLQYVEGYFYEGELDDIEEITFIDVGAYNGDTLVSIDEMYGEQISSYYAYEPSKENYNEMIKNIEKSELKIYYDNIVMKNSALGEVNGTLLMGKSGGEFGIVKDEDNASEKIKVVRLDDEDISVNGRLVIKMDVEGAEMTVLKGGLDTIKKYRPLMAICVYHKYDDIYKLPQYLINNDLNYRFVLKSGIHTHLLAIPQD